MPLVTARSSQPLTRIVGREAERSALHERLNQSRLVTITGPGGIGKTRIALAIANDLDAPSIDLAAITNPDLVASEIAAALGLPSLPSETPSDSQPTELELRHPLIVLDNLEQIVNGRVAVQTLLDRSPSLRILATSRVPLGIQGELEFPLGPLETPADHSIEAIAAAPASVLFLERARGSGELDALSPAAAQAVAEICRHLDGLPLAIELAAARLRVLSPEALAARLAVGASSILTDDRRPLRQRSLDAVVRWSLDALPSDQLAVLSAASVCAGGFDAAAIADLAPGVDALNALDALIGLGLARREAVHAEGRRFRLLETLRVAVRHRLPQVELDALDERHARHFAAVVRESGGTLTGPDSADVTPLLRDRDNIRKALEWSLLREPETALEIAARLGEYWYEVGGLDEGLVWLGRALAAVPSGGPIRLHAQATQVAALDRARHESVIEAAKSVHHAARSEKDGPAKVRALALAAVALVDKVADGERYVDEALAEANALNTNRWVAFIELARGFANVQRGDHEASSVNFMEAALAAEAAGDRVMRSLALGDLTWSMFYCGRMVDALASAHTASTLLLPGEYPSRRAWLFGTLAEMQSFSGQPVEARAALTAAIEVALDHPAIDLFDAALGAAAVCLAGSGDDELAIRAAAAREVNRAGSSIYMSDLEEKAEARMLAPARRRVGEVRAHLLDGLGETEDQEVLLREILQRLKDPGSISRGPNQRRLVHGELTNREVEIMELLADGKSDTEIGAALFISPKTVSVHISNAKGKLGATSRLDLALRAHAMGLGPGP